MQPPSRPENEAQRLQRLHQLDILDTPAEGWCDDITRLAAIVCNTRYATISLVDAHRQWFKSRQGGLDATETSREASFCGHTILQPTLTLVEDATRDPRFHDNPLVTGSPNIRRYAGAPLITSDGFAVGTLCVFDPAAGTLDEGQQEGLQLLARQVVSRLEQRIDDTLNQHIGQILDTSELYVLLLDLRTDHCLYANLALEARLHHKQPGASARNLFQALFPQLSFPDASSAYGHPMPWEQTLETRVCFTPDDEIQTHVRLIHARQDGRNNLLVIIHDQAALRASRHETQEARSNLRLFSQAAIQSENLIILADASLGITWVNPRFEQLTGYALTDCVGRKPGHLLRGPDTAKADIVHLDSEILAGRAARREVLCYCRDGTPVWLDTAAEPLRNERGEVTHYVITQNDISQRKAQEQAILDARDAAEQANRAKSQFLANISHELRTPLNGILGIAELLQDEVPPGARPYITTLNQSSRHLLRLLNDILDLSHIDSGHMKLEPSASHLESELREVVDLFSPRAAESNTRLTLETRGLDKLWVLVDATRLKQVLMNLVANAVKFTEQGEIRIEACATLTSDNLCELELAVTDTGPGIPLADQQRIFEHFEQLDNSTTRAYGGSGLGLAISRQLLRLMGSDLALDSKPGQGARFHTRLTLRPAAPPGDEAPATAPRGRALRNALVIDDNPVNRNILVSMLSHLGTAQVFSAGSGRRGLAMLDNLDLDLVLVDIQMPGMDGFGFLDNAHDKLRQEHRPYPLMVACTAHAGNDHRQRSLERGFDAHIEKPVTRDALRQLLTDLGFATVRKQA